MNKINSLSMKLILSVFYSLGSIYRNPFNLCHCTLSELSRVCNTRMNLSKRVYEQVEAKSVVKKKIHLHVCTFTSFSCEITPYMDERNFWIFQAVTFIIFAVSYSLVRVRQKKLDGQLMDKINRQIASGI